MSTYPHLSTELLTKARWNETPSRDEIEPFIREALDCSDEIKNLIIKQFPIHAKRNKHRARYEKKMEVWHEYKFQRIENKRDPDELIVELTEKYQEKESWILDAIYTDHFIKRGLYGRWSKGDSTSVDIDPESLPEVPI